MTAELETFPQNTVTGEVVSADGKTSSGEAFSYLKAHFGLGIERDYSGTPFAVDSSRHSVSEPELVGNKLVHASLSERMVKQGDFGCPEEMLVVTVASGDFEERGVLTENGMVSFNSGEVLSHERVEAIFKSKHESPGYPFAGWQDAERSRDPVEFRRGIFDVQSLIKSKYKVGNIIKALAYKFRNTGRIRQ